MYTSTSESPNGSQDLNSEASLNNLPTEIFFVIFEYFAPRDVVRCRQVCTHWRDIIDTSILHNDTKWKQFCKHDFPKIYEGAMWKTPDITSWFEMYRSLILWSSLDKAQETIDEFCHSETIIEELKSITVQEKGLILAHKRGSVVFYDLLSLRVAERKGISEEFVSLVELEDIVVLLRANASGDLHIIKKPQQDWHSDLPILRFQDDIVFHEVKSFLVQNRTVFFTKFQSPIYVYNLDDKTSSQITYYLQENLGRWPEPFLYQWPIPIAMGFKNGCHYILTSSKELYAYENKTTDFKYILDTSSNLMNWFYQHNMLENLVWRHYYILLDTLQQRRHTGHLQFITKMHIYGDELFFVGTQSGVLDIYYKPFVDGELNLMQFPPVKSYNFSARNDFPILTVNPIINIQVVETKAGHTVLVCMIRKIQVISYTNDFKKPKSTAIVP